MAGAKAPVKWLLGTILTLPMSEIPYDGISISFAARDPRASICTDRHPSDQAKRSEFLFDEQRQAPQLCKFWLGHLKWRHTISGVRLNVFLAIDVLE